MSDELHIASLIIHVRPSEMSALLDWLGLQPHMDVRASSKEGKVVAVTEREHQRDILQVIDAVEAQPGVLGCTMVYHEVLSPQEAEQELLPLVPTH